MPVVTSPKPRIAAVDDRAIERVGARERERGGKLVALEPELLIVRRIRPADVQAARRQREIRRHDLERLRQQREALRRIGRLLRDLEANPAAAEARERVTVDPELYDLLDVRRVHDRHRRIDERVLALVRQRGRLARVIVAGDCDHAAVARRSGRVAVLERIAGAVDAGPLAVPHAEYAVVTSAGEQVRLLRAPDRGGREILVQARLEANLRGVEVIARPATARGRTRRAASRGSRRRSPPCSGRRAGRGSSGRARGARALADR